MYLPSSWPDKSRVYLFSYGLKRVVCTYYLSEEESRHILEMSIYYVVIVTAVASMYPSYVTLEIIISILFCLLNFYMKYDRMLN